MTISCPRVLCSYCHLSCLRPPRFHSRNPPPSLSLLMYFLLHSFKLSSPPHPNFLLSFPLPSDFLPSTRPIPLGKCYTLLCLAAPLTLSRGCCCCHQPYPASGSLRERKQQ